MIRDLKRPARVISQSAMCICLMLLASMSFVQAEIVPLYFVGTNNQSPAQMALEVVTGSYPSGTGLTNYPPPVDHTVPESVVAAAVRLYMTNDFGSLVNLYDPSERTNVTMSSYNMYQAAFSNVVDIFFDRFYWIGSHKLITYRMNYAGEVGFFGDFWGNKLNNVSGGFYLSDRILDPITALVQMHIYDAARGFSAPLANSYQFSLTCPPFDGHPLKVLFNGTAMRLLIDSNTVASCELEGLMIDLVKTFRTGNPASRLAFWSGPERERLATDPLLLRSKTSLFNAPKSYLIFKLDFGPNAVLFYQNTDAEGNPHGRHQGVSYVTAFKDSDGKYYLTEQNLGGQELFPDNLRLFLSTSFFMDFILQQSNPP